MSYGGFRSGLDCARQREKGAGRMTGILAGDQQKVVTRSKGADRRPKTMAGEEKGQVLIDRAHFMKQWWQVKGDSPHHSENCF